MLRRALPLLALALTACQTGDRLWRITPFESGAEKERVNLWPLAYHSGDETSVLWPLFDVDRQGFALRPLIAKDGSAWSVLFPLASFDSDSGEGWFVPYYHFGNNQGVFPLANFGRLSYVGPVWWTPESRGLFPLAGLGEFSYVGPVWWSGDDDATFASGLFPLLWLGNTNVVGPVWWNAGASGHGVFPLYGRDFLGTNVTHVGPLWWGADEAGATRAGLFPLAWYQDEGRSLGLLPFYWHDQAGESRSRHALLGLGRWQSDAAGHQRWILPLWFDQQRDEARDTVLVPFYWKRVRGDSADVFTLLGNRSVDPDSDTLNVYPLWWSNESAESSWRLLFPFFWYGRSADERTLITPLGGRGWSTSGETAFTNVLGPLYHRSQSTRRDEERTAFLWPLYERHREGEETRTSFAGLYTRTRAPEESETSWLFGLGHAQRTPEGSGHRFWPLYSTSEGLEHPGLFYDFTLVNHEEVGQARETSVFPLYASHSSPSSRGWNALLFLAGHEQEGEEESTWVWPLYGRSRGVFPGLFESFSLWGTSARESVRTAQVGFSLLWSSTRSEEPDRRARHDRALLLFTHEEEEFLTPRVPAPDPDARANRIEGTSTGFLFELFVNARGTQRVWKEGVLDDDEARTLRAYDTAAAREGVPDGAAVRSVLAAHAALPAGESDAELRAALTRFAAENTRTYTTRKLRVPLLFGYEREDDALDWYGPLGSLRYVRDGDEERFSVLWYAYRSERRGARTSRDLFPFLTWDSGPDELDVSFLWRLFHYEREGGRRGGHVLFIPWGDA